MQNRFPSVGNRRFVQEKLHLMISILFFGPESSFHDPWYDSAEIVAKIMEARFSIQSCMRYMGCMSHHVPRVIAGASCKA